MSRRIPPRVCRDREAGVTLVETLVALALFAVIGGAGFTVLDQILRVQSRTEGRLARLAEVQRSMHLVTADFMQAAGGSLAFSDGAVSFRRSTPEGQVSVGYTVTENTLRRRVSGDRGAGQTVQVLLRGVADAGWRFHAPGVGWIAFWPPDPTLRPQNPEAVRLDLTLVGPGLSGPLQRIALLPAEVAR